MLARTALLFLVLTSGAQAAAFDDLKEDLSVCLRHEMGGAGSRRQAPAGYALQRCAVEVDRLERADARRLRSDRGLSPSTWAVIRGVFGRGDRGR